MLPLEGITVIAVEQAVAAPFCSSRLADAGATVIKVERPEGDFARGYDTAAKGQSSYFVWLNRCKQSVVVDLAAKEGRAQLEWTESDSHRCFDDRLSGRGWDIEQPGSEQAPVIVGRRQRDVDDGEPPQEGERQLE